MKNFQELYESILQRREQEKTENPVIKWQMGELGFQIYANNPLQFNVMYGDISAWEKTHQEMDLQFVEREISGKKKFVVSIINPELATHDEKPKFLLDDRIEKLADEFPEEPQVRKIAECLLRCSPNESCS